MFLNYIICRCRYADQFREETISYNKDLAEWKARMINTESWFALEKVKEEIRVNRHLMINEKNAALKALTGTVKDYQEVKMNPIG